MAIVLSDPLKVILVGHIAGRLNFLNTGLNRAGDILLRNSAGGVLCIIEAPEDYFLVDTQGIMTGLSAISGAVSASGTLATFAVRNHLDSIFWEGAISLVGGSGDWQLDSTTLAVTSGDSIGLSSLTYQLGN